MHFDPNGAAVFNHEKNITIGCGRVLWAKAATDINGIAHPEGWVLPGGRRTQSTVEAHGAALALDQLIRGV